MPTLNEYLSHEAAAFCALKERVRGPGYRPIALRAHAVAEGRSGVRRIRIRDFKVILDNPWDFVGYDLGPSSPELALAALTSCITHSFLIQAAALGVPLDSLEVTLTGNWISAQARPATRRRPCTRMRCITRCISTAGRPRAD